MYQTTVQFISAAKTLKEALLLCLTAGKPLRIETGRPGSVPCIPSIPYDVVVNSHFSLQAVDPKVAREETTRFLARPVAGQPIAIICNYDLVRHQTQILSTDSPFIYLDMQSDNAPPSLESVLARMAYSVTLHMPPDAVVALLNYVAEADEFKDENIAALRAASLAVEQGTSEAFKQRVVRAMRATRPDTVESASCRNAGLTATFGYGVGPWAGLHLVSICAAYAALAGRAAISEEDLVRLFPAVVAHSIVWGAAAPLPGYVNGLTKIAQWAVSV